MLVEGANSCDRLTQESRHSTDLPSSGSEYVLSQSQTSGPSTQDTLGSRKRMSHSLSKDGESPSSQYHIDTLL